MNIFSILKGKKAITFIGGIVAGLALPSIVKSKTMKKAAVQVVAKSLYIKDEAKSACEAIKEDAQDVYAEAKKKALEGDCPCEEE